MNTKCKSKKTRKTKKRKRVIKRRMKLECIWHPIVYSQRRIWWVTIDKKSGKVLVNDEGNLILYPTKKRALQSILNENEISSKFSLVDGIMEI